MKSKTPQFLKDFESRLRSTKAVRFLRMRFDRKYAARLRNVNMEQHFNATPSKQADTSAQQSLTAALQSEFRLDPVLFFTPHFNIIIPTLMLRKMSGGPNTILAFGAHLAARGHRVRFISLNEGCEKNLSALMTHIRDVSGIHFDDQLITFVDGSASRSSPVPIGSRDRFMATAWWTFADSCAGAKLTEHKIPYYFKQDFEEVFYEGSEQQTECRATYLAPHHAIYNTSTLKSFFDNHFYVLPQDDHRATAQFFQPAFAADKFYPVAKNGKIRILFYARPNTAPRNLYRMGLRALDYLSASGFLAANEVEVFSIGEDIGNISLSGGEKIINIPWKSYESYAQMVREHDIALSLMWAPHPSYLPLEAAFCGTLAVTTRYANKMQTTFDDWGMALFCVEANAEAICDALQDAVAKARVRRIEAKDPRQYAPTSRTFPEQWDDSFKHLVIEMDGSQEKKVTIR